ncbi:MAG TPA: FKBP-type peptidyl-prolyl cis-trans isomerase [Opitutaceae bacterium]|nr:FKBP-type peptidyl-prolyl cis-trans isomerase [Opitutaceae bacterium]
MARSVITFHFVLRDAAGRLLDTSRGGAPVTFVEGDGAVIDGLAAGLRGLPAGARRVLVVPAAQGYGERDGELVRRVPRRSLPVEDIKVGDRFQTGPDRHAPIVTIAGIEGDEVVLDANHPLAGVELHFEVEVIAVRPATAEERRRGASGTAGGG